MSDPSSSARPTTVTASFWLWVASTVIGVIGAILAIALASTLPEVQQLAETDRAAVIGVVIGTGVFLLIIALVRLLFAWYMYKGRNWARIVLTVLGVLGVVLVLVNAARTSVVEWINLVLVVVAIVLMYLPASNGYFRRGSGR